MARRGIRTTAKGVGTKSLDKLERDYSSVERLYNNFEDIRSIVAKKYPTLIDVTLTHDRFMDDFHKHVSYVYAGTNPDISKLEILFKAK